MPYCSRCGTELGSDYYFCPVCGLPAEFPRQSLEFPRQPTATKINRKIVLAVVLIIMVLVVAISAVSVIQNLETHAVPLSVNGVCDTSTSSSQTFASSNGSPEYDQQQILGFTENFNSIRYNVTAVEQIDNNDYGPVYLVNGLSDAGYWYQAGMQYNWPTGGTGEAQGFRFGLEVWDSRGNDIYDTNNGAETTLSAPVNDGDVILLTLNFSNGYVVSTAHDWNTSGNAVDQYNAFNSTTFIGSRNAIPAFSGLMTEWYHAVPYFCSGTKVTYSNFVHPISSAWACIDEWNFTSGKNILYSDCTPFSYDYTRDPNAAQSFSFEGTTIYSDDYEFITS